MTGNALTQTFSLQATCHKACMNKWGSTWNACALQDENYLTFFLKIPVAVPSFDSHIH